MGNICFSKDKDVEVVKILNAYGEGVKSPFAAIVIPDSKKDFATILFEQCLKPGTDIKNHAALIMDGETMTYGELKQNALLMAAKFLEERMLTSGQVLTLVLPNCFDIVVGTLAASLVGASSALLDPALPTDEIKRRIRLLNPSLVLTTKKDEPRTRVDEVKPKCIILDALDDMKLGCETLAQVVDGAPDNFVPGSTAMSSDAFISFTDATSEAKACRLSHSAVIANMAQIAQVSKDKGEKSLVVLPLANVCTLMSGVLQKLFQRNTVVIQQAAEGECLDRAKLAEIVKECGISCTAMTPTMLHAFTAAGESDELSTLEVIKVCGGKLSEDSLKTAEAFFEASGTKIHASFELAEFPAICTVTDVVVRKVKDIVVGRVGGARAGAIGLLLPNTEAKIVDVNSGIIRDAGSTDKEGTPLMGELVAKGPGMMTGYFGEKDATGLVDGWLKTGHCAYIDGDGFVFVRGPLEDAAKSSRRRGRRGRRRGEGERQRHRQGRRGSQEEGSRRCEEES
eukprot:TRINITY_DN22156_c0_g1_i4.p2 TRINITY_DN22156_c0_g1~~TRINITY_DN22156_c0_g1_i4.p2  ORF type:complete len:511 (-),score=178.95 TRINITY_DN22156_c0_g1_i4:335-1867(-)